MSEFRLTIELGNDAMQGNEDVADALTAAAGMVRSGGFGFYKAIRDVNGNTVGVFGVHEREDSE